MLANTIAPPNTPFKCKVAVNFAYINWTIKSVEIFQENGKHQRAIVTVIPPNRAVLPKSGDAVTIEYGQPAYDWNVFAGYVNHIEYTSTNAVEIWILGASAPMRNATLKVWENVTASYIATKIAIKNKMHIEVDAHSELITEVQSGQSDFQFLADLATRVGYKFFVVGATVYFINPLLPLRDRSYSLPWFWMDSTSFKPKIGELIPGQSQLTDTVQFALDPETGNIIGGRKQYEKFLAFGESKTYSPTVKNYATNNTASSTKEILSKLNAEVSDNIHWVTAACTLRAGSARVQPCDVIGLQGDIADKFQGIWLVDSIVQTLTPSYNNWNYSADVALMRDQIYSTTVQPRLAWSRSSGLIGTRWVNGSWISEQVGA